MGILTKGLGLDINSGSIGQVVYDLEGIVVESEEYSGEVESFELEGFIEKNDISSTVDIKNIPGTIETGDIEGEIECPK